MIKFGGLEDYTLITCNSEVIAYYFVGLDYKQSDEGCRFLSTGPLSARCSGFTSRSDQLGVPLRSPVLRYFARFYKALGSIFRSLTVSSEAPKTGFSWQGSYHLGTRVSLRIPKPKTHLVGTPHSSTQMQR